MLSSTYLNFCLRFDKYVHSRACINECVWVRGYARACAGGRFYCSATSIVGKPPFILWWWRTAVSLVAVTKVLATWKNCELEGGRVGGREWRQSRGISLWKSLKRSSAAAVSVAAAVSLPQSSQLLFTQPHTTHNTQTTQPPPPPPTHA